MDSPLKTLVFSAVDGQFRFGFVARTGHGTGRRGGYITGKTTKTIILANRSRIIQSSVRQRRLRAEGELYVMVMAFGYRWRFVVHRYHI